MSRLRLQDEQKGCVVDETIPKVVPSASRKRAAGAGSLAREMDSTGPYRAVSTSSIRTRGMTFSMDQWVAPPTSMYSMKRTSAGTVLPNSMRSTSSSSLTPRITTLSSLVSAKPACGTARMAAITRSCPSRLVSARKRSGRNVSRLTVSRRRPAARSAGR